MNKLYPYHMLPLHTRIAIERLDADSTLRTREMLSNLNESYAWQYGEVPGAYEIESAAHICSRRFADFR
jgi:hypothetical protein